jgi:hypothetical protein
VLTGPGVFDKKLRQAIEALSANYSGRTEAQDENLPPALRPYVEKIARYAYKVTDEDVEALQNAGYSEDATFEITIGVALGAGLTRLERGLAVLKGDE